MFLRVLVRLNCELHPYLYSYFQLFSAAHVGPEQNISRPCSPSPCGPNIQCQVYGHVAMCDPCGGPDAHFRPECRPECLANSDCPFNLACLGQRCLDPCPGSCGVSALCTVIQHSPVCSCPPGLAGNPFEHCSPPKIRKLIHTVPTIVLWFKIEI